MKELNSSRNFYFIKTLGNPLIENLNEIVQNSTIKMVQSNFPDSIFLPLVVSLFGNNIPDIVLFIEGEDLKDYNVKKIKKWYRYAYIQLTKYEYDYVFGNYQIINNKRIGCSLLLSRANILQHLLYYTDCDTTHINPFIQLSLANKTKYSFLPFNHIKTSLLENIDINRFSFNINCPTTNDNKNPSLCILLPSFKRNYFSTSFQAFSNQTYKPKFYIFIQNDNRIHFNLTFFQSLVKEPIYHIWMQNFNSFFFLNHRLSSVFPCDFILKYDDDQWPTDNKLHEKLINESKNKNVIIGGRGYFVNGFFRCYTPTSLNGIEHGIVVDHMATPFITRPYYLKLDARNKMYSLYHAEDVALSVNSWKLCHVTSIYMKLQLIQKHSDGNSKDLDKQNQLIYDKQKYVFENSYHYLIRSGYIPKRWNQSKIYQKEILNITITHKILF